MSPEPNFFHRPARIALVMALVPNADLAPLDLAIIGIYLIGIVALGVALSRKRGGLVAAIALSAGVYTVAGGLRSVIVTEVIQAVILLGASLVVAVLAFDRAGGWANIVASVPAEKLSLIRPASDPGVPWPGLLLGVPLLGFYFWCTNQFMTQRVLSAKDENHGRWGSLFAGFLKLPILFLMVLPGTAAILIYPRPKKRPISSTRPCCSTCCRRGCWAWRWRGFWRR